ncbi:MAG: chromosome segregation protein SMC, partial [Oscillospiraceae bacterium]|nr:chromosome segregation protein SMC [Oscillospiraceae bacterium]
LSARTADLRTELAAVTAEQTEREASLAQTDALRQDFAGQRERRVSAMDEVRTRTERWEAQLQSLAAEQSRLETESEAARSRLQQKSEARLQTEARRTRSDREGQELNRTLLAMEGECARLEQKRETAALEEKQILDRLWEHYSLTHSAAQAVRMELPSAAKAGRRVTELKRAIAALGTPNLGAIEEYKRLNERYTFLTEQRDDVVKAKSELETVIAGLAEEMKRIFVREFEKINEAFRQTFADLFGGGTARLELEDTENVLDCGIEIRVQPPGKTLKVLSLLSGGEKAFVAIALYFAILKVRPTPFCILDEIEAALDEPNVGRFARYLRRLADKTQFLVITHRRGTMEEADVLYGVTMQEQGVSRMLAIHMDELTKELGIV